MVRHRDHSGNVLHPVAVAPARETDSTLRLHVPVFLVTVHDIVVVIVLGNWNITMTLKTIN